jgi:hypothetical protein
MKAIMLAGGFLGFVIGLGCSLSQGAEWSAALWRASLAAHLGGWLLRWWGQVWAASFREATQQQRAELARPTARPAPNTN